jgi:hypothetical protein
MPRFPFKSYHLRAIHAATAEERAAINRELKALYESLSAEERVLFNEELQTFLVSEMSRLGTDYQAIKSQQSET